MTTTTYKYEDLTRKIIGSAMEVHKIIGNGFQSDRRCGSDLPTVLGY